MAFISKQTVMELFVKTIFNSFEMFRKNGLIVLDNVQETNCNLMLRMIFD